MSPPRTTRSTRAHSSATTKGHKGHGAKGAAKTHAPAKTKEAASVQKPAAASTTPTALTYTAGAAEASFTPSEADILKENVRIVAEGFTVAFGNQTARRPLFDAASAFRVMRAFTVLSEKRERFEAAGRALPLIQRWPIGLQEAQQTLGRGLNQVLFAAASPKDVFGWPIEKTLPALWAQLARQLASAERSTGGRLKGYPATLRVPAIPDAVKSLRATARQLAQHPNLKQATSVIRQRATEFKDPSFGHSFQLLDEACRAAAAPLIPEFKQEPKRRAKAVTTPAAPPIAEPTTGESAPAATTFAAAMTHSLAQRSPNTPRLVKVTRPPEATPATSPVDAAEPAAPPAPAAPPPDAIGSSSSAANQEFDAAAALAHLQRTWLPGRGGDNKG